ncbi:hypothetical protein C8Q79DRAFT_187886 [Trametes meyenii]|nr:hypothetical protein C8Q79DRAFT_187886 [Trametes meyenii]
MIEWRWALISRDPIVGCNISISLSHPMIELCISTFLKCLFLTNKHAVTVLERIPLLLADMASLAITWSTQYEDYKNAQRIQLSASLSQVLLHNGAIYFLVLTILNLLQVVLIVPSVFTPSHMTNLTLFIEPITAILTSSFIADLYRAADHRSRQSSLFSITSIRFHDVESMNAAHY